jgi:hypothetical protein
MLQESVQPENLGGEVAGQQNPELDIQAPSLDAILRPIFDSCVAYMDSPNKIANYVARDPHTKNPIFDYLDQGEVAEPHLQALRQYIRVGFEQNSLSLGTEYPFLDKPIRTIEDLVEAYLESGLLEARLRAQARGDLGAHVTADLVDRDPGTTRTFTEIVRDLAKSAWKPIGAVVHYHSEAIPINNTGSIPAQEMKQIAR